MKAKQFVAKKQKKKALMELKKKKVLTDNLDRIMGKKLNLETQIMTLEEAVMNSEVVSGMKTGANALKQEQQKVDIDAVEDLAALPQVDVQPQKQEHNILDDLPNAPVKPVKPVKIVDDDEAELNALIM